MSSIPRERLLRMLFGSGAMGCAIGAAYLYFFFTTDPQRKWLFVLVILVPGISALIAGLLVLQAPSSVDQLVGSVMAEQPNPPRDVDLSLVWRVTLGYSTWGAYILATAAYLLVAVELQSHPELYRWAPAVLAALLIASLGLATMVAPLGLYTILRTGDRRAIVVKRFRTTSYRGAPLTTVWYDRPDGREASTSLGMRWTGYIHEGDRLDALTDAKTGEVELLLSKPPAHP